MHGTLVIILIARTRTHTHIFQNQQSINKEHVKPPRKSHASVKISAVGVESGDSVRSRK